MEHDVERFLRSLNIADVSCEVLSAHVPGSDAHAEDEERAGRIDLHIHTCVSDGSDTADDVIAQAVARGMSCIAITNHDTTKGLDDAVAAGRAAGIRVIGGVEISAWDPARGRKVHVLGYGLHDDAPAIAALCTPTLERRCAASSWQVDQLRRAGYRFDERTVRSLAQRSTCLYKQHIMEALTDAPHNSPAYHALYVSLFKGNGICARDIAYVDMAEAVRAIVADGGCPVLAHPGQLDSYDAVPELVEAGLRGIERFHPDHTAADHVRCRELASRYGLVCTAGSDYHGRFGAAPHLGYRIPV